ncbi:MULTISPECIES: DUF3885 domain-containing protein [Bacillus cereus group]|uniref:DUF3885 domain-containing protein n=1 Tax=Bacillus thuringiensis TaxID=1428 RepID=A0A1C4CAK4_BACTU|nr:MULTISPECIES: DUF3885 domain-containing protein [Bacillus cereus group]MCC2324295.1 DUF3885 domain-containing protein [Bacillus wiedmannii]MDP1456641.1 DUF3885 domain-containing protein [Bacillus wiedmannii]MED2014002.1 DUF3885 domain-containing protein [Bacillus wiedmannii]MED3021081.1 DUF3885 domain-containing protein [Bacillus wiedmannii]OTX95909.1 hypothetical protein BK729_24955 [Bacillus thuringiensis serovar wratislaviensis]
MRLNEYMLETFPNLELRPPLFYNGDIGIRFRLGVNYDCNNIYENCPYLEGVYNRAITLFQSLHATEDDIYIVVDVNDYADGEIFKHKLNIFSKYVKEKSDLFKLQKNTIPYIFPEDDEDGVYKTHRYTLKCKVSDLKYIPMLKAICNQDMGIKPRIFHRVYFININNNTIFHVYDDRGCDVLATSPNTIRDIYHTYNDWILEYDRNKIDKVFN